MLGKQLIHLEHVSTISLENNTQRIVTYDLPLVTRVLEVVLPYVSPQLPHNLKKKHINVLITNPLIAYTHCHHRARKTVIITSVLGRAGSPTTTSSSGETLQTLFNPPGPPFLLVPAGGALQRREHSTNPNSLKFDTLGENYKTLLRKIQFLGEAERDKHTL